MWEPDDLEKLLADVRKIVSDNNQFIQKLADESTEDDLENNQEDETEGITIEEDFEEL